MAQAPGQRVQNQTSLLAGGPHPCARNQTKGGEGTSGHPPALRRRRFRPARTSARRRSAGPSTHALAPPRGWLFK